MKKIFRSYFRNRKYFTCPGIEPRPVEYRPCILPLGQATLKRNYSYLLLILSIACQQVYRIPKRLPKLYTTPFGATLPVLQTPQRNFQILRTNKLGRRLHKPKQTPGKFMSISYKTITEKQTTYSHVRCKFHCSRICNYD